MAHTSVTKAHSDIHGGVANTYSYSGSFDVFKGKEVVVTLDAVALTFQPSTINESASPREYTVDTSAKTIHIGGGNLSSGTIIIRPVTDLGQLTGEAPKARATYSPGSSITSEDLNNNQTQLLRKALEYDADKMSTTGDTMTGHLTMGEDTTIIFEGATADAHETTLTVVDPTADRTISLPNVTGTVVTTGDTGTVTATMLAADSVDSSELVDGSIDASHIATGAVETAKLANDAVTGAQLADDAVDSEHIVADSIDAEHYAPGSVDATALASDSVTFAKIGCEQTTISDTDTSIPTSGAVVDYVAAQIAPIGGFEVIADDESFPNTIPAAGVVISITDAAGLSVNSSGVSTNGDALDNSTITINGFPTELRGGATVGGQTNADPFVFASGAGLMVRSTGSSQTYDYHQAMIRESDFVRLSDDINDFNSRYRIAGSAPGSDNDAGDLYYDTGTDKMYVRNADNDAWGEVTSTGEFKYLVLCVFNSGTGNAGVINGSVSKYDLRETSTSGSLASITSAAQLLVSVNGVIQKANTGTSTPSEGFAMVDGHTIQFGTNLPSSSSVFIVQIGSAVSIPTPGDNTVTSAKIVNGTIATIDIADDAITEAKLATLGDVRWGDNSSIVLGAGSDGLLFSDGSNGFYRTGGTAGTFTIQSGAGTPETIAKFIGDGAVELYHNNSKKVETDSTGITVFGTEGGAAQIHIKADEGDDNPDIWRIIGEPSGPQLNFQSYNSGSYTNTLRMTGDQGVDLYYNNGITFQTKAGGVKLNGHSEQSVNALGNISGSTVINFSTANIITATLTGATTFANPTTESVGQSGSIIVTQDGTGGRTLAWGTQFKWTGGAAPTLSTAASAVDRIDYLVVGADTIHCVASLDVK